MKVDIRFRGLEPSSVLEAQATRQVLHHLGPFGQELSHVVVRVSDVNGPRGGVDKHCQISARGPRLASTLRSRSSDASTAVDLAVKRLEHVLRRQLERLRDLELAAASPRYDT